MTQAKKNYRAGMRDRAVLAIEQAEVLLGELVDSYCEKEDGKFSASHPHNAYVSAHQQLAKLRKSLKRAMV